MGTLNPVSKGDSEEVASLIVFLTVSMLSYLLEVKFNERDLCLVFEKAKRKWECSTWSSKSYLVQWDFDIDFHLYRNVIRRNFLPFDCTQSSTDVMRSSVPICIAQAWYLPKVLVLLTY
jgi:hypothetical protein